MIHESTLDNTVAAPCPDRPVLREHFLPRFRALDTAPFVIWIVATVLVLLAVPIDTRIDRRHATTFHDHTEVHAISARDKS